MYWVMSSLPSLDFGCPSCNKTLTAPPELFGQSVSCPECNQLVHVPSQQAPTPQVRPIHPKSSIASAGRASQTGGMRRIVGVVGIVIGIVMIGGRIHSWAKGGSVSTQSGASRYDERRVEATTRTMVLKNLKSPSTASFSGFRMVRSDPPFFQTAVNVDANNSFGGMIRKCFVCTFKLGEGSSYFSGGFMPVMEYDDMDTVFGEGTAATNPWKREAEQRALEQRRAEIGWPGEGEQKKADENFRREKPAPISGQDPIIEKTTVQLPASIPVATVQTPAEENDQEGSQPIKTEREAAKDSPQEHAGTSDNRLTHEIIMAGLRCWNMVGNDARAEYKIGETLVSDGTLRRQFGTIPAGTLVFPVRIKDVPMTILYCQDEFGEWLSGLQTNRTILLPIKATSLQGKSTPEAPSNSSTPANADQAKASLAEVEGKIAAEKQRWTDATAVINKLTNNKRTPVREGTQEYYKCVEASKIIQEVEKGAADLKAEKARLEAIIKGGN